VKAGQGIRQHSLPRRFADNRTHLVWHGDASPALRGLLALLEEEKA
jgi:hypothetical protein